MRSEMTLRRGWRALAAGIAGMGMGVGAAAAGDCVSSAYITEGTFSGKNHGIGLTASAICSQADVEGDAWFEYLAAESGILNVSVSGKSARHVISIWEGCPGAGGDLVCREDGRQAFSTIAGAVVQEGSLYHIRVSNLSDREDEFLIDIDIAPRDESIGGVQGGAIGADVAYEGFTQVASFGPVGNKRAYIFDGDTCNLGDQALRWGGSWQGSPSLAFNMYRWREGRLTQIGQSFTKQACCAAAMAGCGNCTGQGGTVLGAGCLDIYSASWNALQNRLGPRSNLNAFTGAHILAPSDTGNAIYKRLQVDIPDIDPGQNPAGTMWFGEGVFVASDDAPAGNALNNASWRRIIPSAGGASVSVTGPMQRYVPAITAWKTIEPSVIDGIVDVPNEGRFHTAVKVTDLGGGNYRYDYAIFNLNSDRSGGSFSVPLGGAVPVNIGFHDVDYHSGEPYDNTDWVVEVTSSAITWRSPQTFAQNPNSNALRWGTMYNFWFETDRAPMNGEVTLGLFKPHTPQSVNFAAPHPELVVLIPGDMNCDGVVTVSDIGPFVLAVTDPAAYAAAFPNCDIMQADLNSDGQITVSDIGPFVAMLTQ
jgi:hypothetical protein